MTLLNAGLAFAGLSCIAIPIVIHLLMHRRRKPVMWGAMRFLVEAYKRQRRRLLLEKWLLLAARILLLALIALALGKPMIGGSGGSGGGYTMFLLIDNGLASQVQSSGGSVGEGSALDRHKAWAKSMVAQLRDRAGSLGGVGGGGLNRVGVITLAGPSAGLVAPPSTDLSALSSVIDSIAASDAKTDLAGGMALVASAMAPQASAQASTIDPERTLVIVLSDFLQGSLDLSSGSDALASARLPKGVRVLASQPQSTAPGNVAIVGVEPVRSVLVGADAGSRGSPAGSEGEVVRVLLRRSGAGLDQAQTSSVDARLATIDLAGAASIAPPAGSTPGEGRTSVRWSPGQETASAVVPLRGDTSSGRRVRSSPTGAGTGTGTGVIVATIESDALPADDAWRTPIELRRTLRVGVSAPIQFGRAERVDKLDPGAWARLALSPTIEGEALDDIEIVNIEPAVLDASRLLGLDALILPRPDALPESAWGRIRQFISSGGLVIVAPPPGVTVHTWADAMTRAIPLGWTLARESTSLSEGRLVRRAQRATGSNASGSSASGSTATESSPSPTTGNAPSSGDAEARSGDQEHDAARSLLALIDGELDDLLKPITVRRVLAMTGGFDERDVVLSVEGGPPVLWVGGGAGGVGGAGEAGAIEVPRAQAGSEAKPGTEAARGRGLLVYLGVALDLEWSDLPAKPLMVPMIQEIIRQGVGRARGSWMSVAGVRTRVPSRSAELLRVSGLGDRTANVESSGGSGTSIPKESVRVEPGQGEEAGLTEAIPRASVWRAVDVSGASRGVVAINPDPRGGRTSVQDTQSVGAWLASALGQTTSSAKPSITWLDERLASTPEAMASGASAALSTSIGSAQRGRPIWFELLIAAGVLAILELVLARRASHAQTLGAPASIASASGLVTMSPSSGEARS